VPTPSHFQYDGFNDIVVASEKDGKPDKESVFRYDSKNRKWLTPETTDEIWSIKEEKINE